MAWYRLSLVVGSIASAICASDPVSYILLNEAEKGIYSKILVQTSDSTLNKQSLKRLSVYLVYAAAKDKRRNKAYAARPETLFDVLYTIKGDKFSVTNTPRYEDTAQILDQVDIFCLADSIGTFRSCGSECYGCPLETTLLSKQSIDGDTLYTYKVRYGARLTHSDYLENIIFNKKFIIKKIGLATYGSLRLDSKKDEVIYFE